MVRVCDAIMGSGKSQSAIRYMNEHKDEKFVYLGQTLSEAKRIKDGCKELKFVEPAVMPSTGLSKIEHTKVLLDNGCNIATTHAAFSRYSYDMIESIKNNGYTLIMDEVHDVLKPKEDCSAGDLEILISSNRLRFEADGNMYVTGDIEYTGRRLMDLYELSKCNNLVYIDPLKKHDCVYYFWQMPAEVLTSFKDVFILTYMFGHSELCYFLKIFNIEYENIYIQRDGDIYRFIDTPSYVPGYTSHLSDMIDIYEYEPNKTGRRMLNINSIGERRTALSLTQQKNNKDVMVNLKTNLGVYFRRMKEQHGATNEDLFWGSFDCAFEKCKGKGYGKRGTTEEAGSFECFNYNASNRYSDRTFLAYLANVFVKPQKKMYFEKFGISYNEDMHALSIMIQWIWRSAIRKGEKIHIYVPSRRMRTLLKEWIAEVERMKGCD